MVLQHAAESKALTWLWRSAGARANPMMAVCGNTLWMLGGVVEVNILLPVQRPMAPTAMFVMPLRVEHPCAAVVRGSHFLYSVCG